MAKFSYIYKPSQKLRKQRVDITFLTKLVKPLVEPFSILKFRIKNFTLNLELRTMLETTVGVTEIYFLYKLDNANISILTVLMV